jgi:hypothetical protein
MAKVTYHCRLCGPDVDYRRSEINANGLCEDHKHEFDEDDEEAEDRESYMDNLIKDI